MSILMEFLSNTTQRDCSDLSSLTCPTTAGVQLVAPISQPVTLQCLSNSQRRGVVSPAIFTKLRKCYCHLFLAPGDGFAGVMGGSEPLQRVPYTPALQRSIGRADQGRIPATVDHRLDFSCEDISTLCIRLMHCSCV